MKPPCEDLNQLQPRHFRETHHALMRAVAPDAWTWCCVHEAMGNLAQS